MHSDRPGFEMQMLVRPAFGWSLGIYVIVCIRYSGIPEFVLNRNLS